MVAVGLWVAGCGTTVARPPAPKVAPHAIASAIPAGAFWHPRQLGRWTPPKNPVAPKPVAAKPAAVVPAQTAAVVHTPTKPAPPPASTGQLAMRDVHVADPLVPGGPITGFKVTLNTVAGTATVGPGWVLYHGQFIEIYSGGTLTLPASIPALATTYPGWPEIDITGLPPISNGEAASPPPYATPTVGVYGRFTAPVFCEGDLAIPHCAPTMEGIASVGESFGFAAGLLGPTQVQFTFAAPTWETMEYEPAGTVWSGGSFGAGTPSLPPSH